MPCTKLYSTQLGGCWYSPWKLAQTAAPVFCLQHTVSTYMTSLHPTMNGILHCLPIGLDLKTVTLKQIFLFILRFFFKKDFGFPGWVVALMPLVNSLVSILSSEWWLCKLPNQEMGSFSLLCILFTSRMEEGKRWFSLHFKFSKVLSLHCSFLESCHLLVNNLEWF